MLIYVLMVFALALLTEALTEVAIKSTIFKPIRERVSKVGVWVKELLSCGYCFSFWVAWFLTTLSDLRFPLTDINVINCLLMALIVHRSSNVIHNVIDKWTDKYYDTRYINTDKSAN